MRPTVARCLVVACAIALTACEADAPADPAKEALEQEPDRFVQVMEESEGEREAPEEAAPEEGGPAEGGPAEGGPAEGGPAEGGPAEGGPATAASERSETSGEPAGDIDRKNTGVNKASKSDDIVGKKIASEAKLMRDLNDGSIGIGSVGSTGRGAGGMGMRGTGKGGGGQGFGRIGGLGSVGVVGSGKAAGAKLSARAYRRPAPRPEPTPRANTEDYTNHGVNQMIQTAKDAQSTFAIDVDTGSYTIARRKLDAGQTPPASSVRVEEFVNYFRYSYPDPDSGPFGVHMEAAPSPFVAQDEAGKHRKILRVGVQGKRVTKTNRKPVHLTFLVDVSGSMSSPDKLGLAQTSLEILTNNLHKGDSVAISTYAGRVAKILEPTGMENRGRILNAIKSLRSGGSTAMNSGLELAYKLALENFHKDHVNRVIVLSDGDANVGPSSHQEILKRIKHFVAEGVTLSTIGFGMGNYKDALMEQLANNGNGNYYYIDSEKEARKVFGEQLDGTLQVIAKDVKIQVEFEPDAVKSYRLIGYENRDIADKDFRDDKIDAGEIGAGHTVTALYELVLTDKEVNKLATVRIRHKKPDAAKASEQTFSLTRGDLKDSVRGTSKDFQFATAVAGFAEILRDSPFAKDLSFDLVEEIARGGTLSGQQDREEFIDLVKKAKSLERG